MPSETGINSATARRRARRQRAAARAATIPPSELSNLPPAEVERLVHELRVHQIELEMQNEELLRAQVELEEARARYFDLYNLAPVGYLTLSEKGLILEANLHAADVLGLPRRTLARRVLARLIHPDDSSRFRDHYKQLFRTGAGQACEVRLAPRRAGAPITWVHLELFLAQDEQRQAAVCHAILRDITERRRSEAALQCSEGSFRTLLMLSPDGISVTDQTGRILACNEQFAHLHGYDRSLEMVGRYAQEFARPEVFARLHREVAAALGRGERVARGIECELLRRDGSSFTAEYSVSQVPWPEAPSGVAFVANVRDITHRKEQAAELERHRLHLEKLVQARTAELQAEIAEREAAQDALRRSKQALAAAQHVAHIGSWERDLHTGEFLFSDEMYHIFGLDRQDPRATPDGFWGILHPDDRDAAGAIHRAVAQTDASHEATHCIRLPSGKQRVVCARTQLVRDAAGQPARVIGTVQDITEQERVREELNRRIQELWSLQELSNLVSLKSPPQEIIHLCLDRLTTFGGFDLAQIFLQREGHLRLAGMRTRLPGQVAQEESVAAGECLCGLAAQTRQPVYTGDAGNDPRCTRDFCYTNGLHSAAAFPLDSGDEVIGALVVATAARDALADRINFLQMVADLITVRLHNALLHQKIQEHAAGLEEIVAERTRELQTERDRTEVILETVGEGVVVTDLDGQVLFLNPAASALTGFARDDELGQPLWRHWTAQARTEVWPRAQAGLRADQIWQGEISGRRKDGATYTIAVTATPLYDASAGSSPVGGVWAQRDVTALKEAARLKDQFVANVSHELRTPISIIALSCDNLGAFHHRLDAAQRLEILHDIQEQARRLNNILEDTLQVAQIDAGRAPKAWTRVDLASLVRDEVEGQQPIAEQHALRLTTATDAAVEVVGNAVQLRQIVRNLLDNAIKYTPAGGLISCSCTIRTAALPAGPEAIDSEEHRWAVLEVADSGIGIPARDLPFVFERFFRVNGEMGIPGTGLGLPIAQELARLHGGRITVASTLGLGSTFTVYLPAG